MHLGDDGFRILRPRLYRQHVTTPVPLPDDSWAVDERSLKAFADKLKEPPAERAWYELRREAERIALVPGFDRLITLDANAIKELPHQIDVAQRVLRDMGGRAILADEVGLGKTIEASIIYKELAIRGLARRALILTPASLVGQWQGELEEKVFERFDTPTDPHDWAPLTQAIISSGPAPAPAATPRGHADARRSGPVPAHPRVPAAALSGRLHSAGRAGRGGRRAPTPQADQEGDPAARRHPPAPAAVLLVAGARRIARPLGRERAHQPRVPRHRAAARQAGGGHQDARQAGRADQTPERNTGPARGLQRSPPDDSADRRAGEEARPAADRLLGRALDRRSGQAHPRLPRGPDERPDRHPRRQRRTEPPVLQRARELRPPLEPDGGRATHRPAAPHRADARGPHREPRSRGDDRVLHPPAARPEDQAVRAGRGRAGLDPR